MLTARLLPLILLLAPAAAHAQGRTESIYTKLLLNECGMEMAAPNQEMESARWWCRGYHDLDVLVAEGDLRFFVSYGPNAENELAAGQTLPQFNHIHDTLEWRVEPAPGGGWEAFATILRFFLDATESSPAGQVLVVTRLGETGTVCHVAYVDALLNPNANALAREAADTIARIFTCSHDEPGWIGNTRQPAM
jgi:hypothetical protein